MLWMIGQIIVVVYINGLIWRISSSVHIFKIAQESSHDPSPPQKKLFASTKDMTSKLPYIYVERIIYAVIYNVNPSWSVIMRSLPLLLLSSLAGHPLSSCTAHEVITIFCINYFPKSLLLYYIYFFLSHDTMQHFNACFLL